MSSLQQYIDIFNTERTSLESGSCTPLNACRDTALKALLEKGLPTRHNERYKYCDVEAAFSPDYGINLHRVMGTGDPYETYRCNVPNLRTSLYFVVGDTVFPGGAHTAPLPEGVVVTSLCKAAENMPELIKSFYNKAASRQYDGVTALNTLLVQDGLFIYIPEGIRLKHPIQVVNVSNAGFPLMSNRRVLLLAEKECEATLLFCEHAFGSSPSLSTQTVEAFIEEDAAVNIYSIEETAENHARFCNLYVEQEANSHVTFNGVSLTCGQTRNGMDFRLLGEGADVVANGAVIADRNQYVDNNILIEHVAPKCSSDLLYKCVLNGNSTSAFAGYVLVRPDAQQTNSQQTNANICISPTAHAYSQPMLEIYADDVKCSHGSTIGKLDETALFYMQQRGIPEEEARLLLQHAFINDVLRRVSIEHLRDRLSHLVDSRFRGQLTPCRDCRMCK